MLLSAGLLPEGIGCRSDTAQKRTSSRRSLNHTFTGTQKES